MFKYIVVYIGDVGRHESSYLLGVTDALEVEIEHAKERQEDILCLSSSRVVVFEVGKSEQVWPEIPKASPSDYWGR